MATRFGRRRLGVVIALVLAAALLMVAAQVTAAQQPPGEPQDRVGANQVSAATAVPGGPGYLMIHHSAFRPRYSSTQYEGGLSLRTVSGADVFHYYYQAPVYLPNGATIKQLTLYYKTDNDPSVGFEINLVLMPMPGTTHKVIATIDKLAAGLTGTFETTTKFDPSPAVVDLAANAYYLNLWLPPSTDVAVYGVRIDYAFDAYLPLAVKQ